MGSGIAPVPAPDAAAGDGVLEGARERFDVLIFLVPEVGVEPTLPEGNGILSPAECKTVRSAEYRICAISSIFVFTRVQPVAPSLVAALAQC